MEERLRERVVGQDPALTAISDALRRNRAGLARSQAAHRVASCSWAPPGVGKTEVARALAEFLFDEENALVRIDMSEFTHEADATRLIGAAPGYVGYEEGGRLTEAIRRRPYAVILLDEMEKAHPRIFDLFLQVLEDGRLTDGQGRTVNFRNTVVLMTTNVGSQAIFDGGRRGAQGRGRESRRPCAQHFRPEFLNRLDEVVTFRALSLEDMKAVARIQMKRVAALLEEQHVGLEVPDEVWTGWPRRASIPSWARAPQAPHPADRGEPAFPHDPGRPHQGRGDGGAEGGGRGTWRWRRRRCSSLHPASRAFTCAEPGPLFLRLGAHLGHGGLGGLGGEGLVGQAGGERLPVPSPACPAPSPAWPARRLGP